MNALTFLDNVNRYIIRKTRDESFIVRSLNRGRTVWPRIVIRGPRANTRADILTTVTGFSQPGWNKNVGVPCSILLMGLETGWSGITQPGIENRFMDSVVSQLQYPDAYRVATDAKKRKRKKGEKMRMRRALRVLRPVLLWMLNRPRDYAADFKYACPIPTDADRLRENVHLCLSRAKLGYALGSPCRARDQWRPRASLFGKFCFHERDTNWIGGIRVGWFLEMKRTGKLVLVREWNYLRNIYMFSPFLGRDV